MKLGSLAIQHDHDNISEYKIEEFSFEVSQ